MNKTIKAPSVLNAESIFDKKRNCTIHSLECIEVLKRSKFFAKTKDEYFKIRWVKIFKDSKGNEFIQPDRKTKGAIFKA